MRRTGGLLAFVKSRNIETGKRLRKDKWEKFLEDAFQVSESPPTMVILRGVLYDLKKQKEKARKVWDQMMKEAKARNGKGTPKSQ
ncbi:MAG: hypothetical protein HYT40_03640 [Candidatus Sungbacteria bacterium]|uniref:Uncharacterized protein n=1 Tax=Candidatus Sungiibacteriota bacterium TaxID=2750080 RepID=A0A931WP04_9BACT|nr:hypothetical protein [Candidatus Sungbacteria bacterium]